MNEQSQGPLAGSSSTPNDAALAGSTASSNVHDLLERAGAGADQLQNKVQPVVSRLPQAAQAPVYRAVHSAADAAATLVDRAEDVVERHADFVDSTAEYVRQNPLKSVGIAFLAGWLFAKLT